jgi:predicted outer membrane lipoprotein
MAREELAMITLEGARDYVWLFLIAGAFGAIGGLAYELLQVRVRHTGTLEAPAKLRDRFYDLGFIASMLLGAIAAVAISYFFTPEVLVKTTEKGAEVIRTKWQVVKVVPLSIIVGSAGGAFLGAMQARVLAEVNKREAIATKAASKTAVTQLAEASKAAAKVAAERHPDDAVAVTEQAASGIDLQLEAAIRSIDEAASTTMTS